MKTQKFKESGSVKRLMIRTMEPLYKIINLSHPIRIKYHPCVILHNLLKYHNMHIIYTYFHIHIIILSYYYNIILLYYYIIF
jgi:hypothetical protein